MEKELKKLREVEGRVNDRMDKGNDDVYADVKSHFLGSVCIFADPIPHSGSHLPWMYRWLKQNRTRMAPDNAV